MEKITVHKACVERLKAMINSDLFTNTNRPTRNDEFVAINENMVVAMYRGQTKSLQILAAYARGLSDAMNYVLPKMESLSFGS